MSSKDDKLTGESESLSEEDFFTPRRATTTTTTTATTKASTTTAIKPASTKSQPSNVPLACEFNCGKRFTLAQALESHQKSCKKSQRTEEETAASETGVENEEPATEIENRRRFPAFELKVRLRRVDEDQELYRNLCESQKNALKSESEVEEKKEKILLKDIRIPKKLKRKPSQEEQEQDATKDVKIREQETPKNAETPQLKRKKSSQEEEQKPLKDSEREQEIAKPNNNRALREVTQFVYRCINCPGTFNEGSALSDHFYAVHYNNKNGLQ